MADDTAARYAEAERSLSAPFDLEKATVEHERRPAKVVYSARIPAEYTDEIADEARRTGRTPSQVICDLVVEALEARRETAGVTIAVNDIRQFLAAAAHRQAAA